MGHRDQPQEVDTAVSPAGVSAAVSTTAPAGAACTVAFAGYHTPLLPCTINPWQRLAATPTGHTEELANGPTGDGGITTRGPRLPGPAAVNVTVAESDPGAPPPETAEEYRGPAYGVLMAYTVVRAAAAVRRPTSCLARGWIDPMGPNGSPPSTAVMTDMLEAGASPPRSCASRRAATSALMAAGELKSTAEAGG